MRILFWIGMGFVVIVMLLARSALTNTSLRFNQTASVPVGFYRTSHAIYAGICLPKAVADMAAKAGDRLDAGECPDGKQPVLKTIYRASLESPIWFSPSGFTVGGQVLPNTAPKQVSLTGKPLTHWPYGAYTSGIWAISSYNANSLDSRYFGEVKESDIRFYAEPLITF